MARQPPVMHRLLVPRGFEDSEPVQRAYGALQARHGKEHVELVIEEPPDAENPTDEPPDLCPRRVIRVAPDPDE